MVSTHLTTLTLSAEKISLQAEKRLEDMRRLAEAVSIPERLPSMITRREGSVERPASRDLELPCLNLESILGGSSPSRLPPLSDTPTFLNLSAWPDSSGPRACSYHDMPMFSEAPRQPGCHTRTEGGNLHWQASKSDTSMIVSTEHTSNSFGPDLDLAAICPSYANADPWATAHSSLSGISYFRNPLSTFW
jgi:hypothetical protein